MKDLKKLLWQRLWEKKIAKISKWAFLNKALENFLEQEFWIKTSISGKIENNIYFVKSSNSSFSNLLFLNKKKVLEHLNDKISKMDLWTINDIKII